MKGRRNAAPLVHLPRAEHLPSRHAAQLPAGRRWRRGCPWTSARRGSVLATKTVETQGSSWGPRLASTVRGNPGRTVYSGLGVKVVGVGWGWCRRPRPPRTERSSCTWCQRQRLTAQQQAFAGRRCDVGPEERLLWKSERKGTASDTKAAETQGKGSVLPALIDRGSWESARKGTVLATETVEIQGKGSVLPPPPAPPAGSTCRGRLNNKDPRESLLAQILHGRSSAAPPSHFSRRFNRGGERASG